MTRQGDRLLFKELNVAHAFLTAARNSTETKSSLSPYSGTREQEATWRARWQSQEGILLRFRDTARST